MSSIDREDSRLKAWKETQGNLNIGRKQENIRAHFSQEEKYQECVFSKQCYVFDSDPLTMNALSVLPIKPS